MRSAGALPSQREKKLKEQNSSRCPVALLMNSLKEARCPLAGPPANLFGWRDACGLQLASRGGEPREQEEVVVVVVDQLSLGPAASRRGGDYAWKHNPSQARPFCTHFALCAGRSGKV